MGADRVTSGYGLGNEEGMRQPFRRSEQNVEAPVLSSLTFIANPCVMGPDFPAGLAKAIKAESNINHAEQESSSPCNLRAPL